MTVLVTADLHLSDNPRDSYRLDFLKRLPGMVERHKVDTLLVLGDLTEEKDRHGAWLVNRIVDEVVALAKLVQVTILQGNHDYIDVEHPFFRLLAHLEGVAFVTHPTMANTLLGHAHGAWGPILLLPHTRNPKKDWAAWLPLESGTTVFAHNTFAGADAGHGRRLDGIPLDLIPEGCRVYSGDVHVPQVLGPVTYVGAPYTIDFGDSFQPRILIFDDAGKAKSLRLSSPQKALVELEKDSDLLHAMENADVGDGDIVKLRVELKHSDYHEWPAIRARLLKEAAKAGLKVHAVLPHILQSPVNQHIRRESTPQSDMELLEEYAKHRGVDKATLRTGKLLLEAT